MKALRDFGCGAVVGVANIIPGVSGGTMAVVLGVYAQLLEAMGLKNLRKNTASHFLTVALSNVPSKAILARSKILVGEY